MNKGTNQKKATKHYQNSSYPSGSFEDAIENDHKAGLSEGISLRLERHPSIESESAADLEEMIPAFMRRDFFRSKDEGMESSCDIDEPNRPAPAATSRPAKPTKAQGYVEPPRTEQIKIPPSTESAPTPSAPSTASPSDESLAEKIKKAASPAPLRSSQQVAAAQPLRRPSALPTPNQGQPFPLLTIPPSKVSVPELGSSEHNSIKNQLTSFSVPLLLTLAIVVGLFLWREQTRAQLVEQASLPIPRSLPTTAVQDEHSTDLNPPVQNFQPNYVWVGPPSPGSLNLATADSDSTASPEAEKDTSTAAQETAEQPQEDNPQPQIATAAPVAPDREEDTVASGPSTSNLASSASVSAQEKSKPAPKVKHSTKESPAPKPATTTVSASAAELFPIDEEIPLSQTNNSSPDEGYSDYQTRIYSKPTFNYPHQATQTINNNSAHQAANPAPSAQEASKGYKIAEPNL